MSTPSTARSKALLAALVVAGIVTLAFLNLHAAPQYLAELEGSDGGELASTAAGSAPAPEPSSEPEPAVAAAPPAAGEVEPPSESSAEPPAEPELAAPETEATGEPLAAAPEPPKVPSAVAGQPPPIAALHFGSGSSALGQRNRQLLFEVARHMRATRGQKVLLQGHADEQGSAEVNAALSLQRARAAAAHLIELGASQQYVRITGVGESMPADRGDSPESLARNRRVVVIWQ